MTTTMKTTPATPGHRGSEPAPNHIPSSSPYFATPANPILTPHPRRAESPVAITAPSIFPQLQKPTTAGSVLPIVLPPATLRPIAFRTFTKKHNLTLTSSALQSLATFIGKHCGSGWREEGLVEPVLEEVARQWKKNDGKVIVDTDGERLKLILRSLEGSMSGGKISYGSRGGLQRQESLVHLTTDRPSMERNESLDSMGMSGLDVEDDAPEEDDEEGVKDPRKWLKVVHAFEQPKMLYNPTRKHFEKCPPNSSFLAPASQKAEIFTQRYHLVHQRILRNESFQAPVIAKDKVSSKQAWRITPVANLLGRDGTGHLLLGVLTVASTGALTLSDPSGSVKLDVKQASSIDDEVETWLCPGMVVLADGVYEEGYNPAAGNLGQNGGVGGTISGQFAAFSIGAPRAEARHVTLGQADVTGALDHAVVNGGFGWTDFIGLGSERAVGSRMRRLEQRLLINRLSSRTPAQSHAGKMIILGAVDLSTPKTLSSLHRVLSLYDNEQAQDLPLCFVLMGSFVRHAALSCPQPEASTATDGNDTSSITYKEHFNTLASLLAEFPRLLCHCTFCFVPGDDDPWPSSISAGAAVPLPRSPVPEMFTSRIKRAFATAASDSRNVLGSKGTKTKGEAIWTTNPSRISMFGPCHEVVLFRDNISGRLRRNSISLKPREKEADNASQDTENASQDVNENGDKTDTDRQVTPPQQSPYTGGATTQTQARCLTKTILDQSHLSPFPISTRPLNWGSAHSLSLYPLPSALILCDTQTEPFSLVYQGCCVANTGSLVGPTAKGRGRDDVKWIEYDACIKRAQVKEIVL